MRRFSLEISDVWFDRICFGVIAGMSFAIPVVMVLRTSCSCP